MFATRTMLGVLAGVSLMLSGASARAADLSDLRHEVLAFYYGWYKGDWMKSAHFRPASGAYQSMDSAQADRQAREASDASITGFILDWSPSPGRYTDAQMPVLLAAAGKQGLHVSALLTKWSASPATPDVVLTDVTYLIKSYGDNPAWLRVGGKPVIFIYSAGLAKMNTAVAWNEALTKMRQRFPGLVVLSDGQNDPVHLPQSKAAFDGLFHYTEVPNIRNRTLPDIQAQVEKADQHLAKTQDGKKIFCLTVSPGYDDSQTNRPKPRPIAERYDGETYRATWRAAIAANPDWILIGTYNEWIEGSQIEPSAEFGDQAMRDTGTFAREFLAKPVRGGTAK